MPDGKHCPACGKDVGYWAVARGLFGIRCPHCRTWLLHRLDSRMSAILTVAVIADVLVALVPGFFAAALAYPLVGPWGTLAIGVAVWVGVAFGLGFVIEIIVAPALCRTQRLIAYNGEPETPDEESW
jgi:hypothetical protein